ncbi:AraC family transcriptional regulator [Parahaliea maris]|uniref:AraC family transcriptional regulator n=1 Tax=Parahaliea maris TaxID=2716870 RepID=A0A5C8ZTW7_9GAMM|nr:AraC family transcriptional regulator [Parahaliea maris]TXS90711.1 AraC family transcriptional regulator [Parahaliea maris]
MQSFEDQALFPASELFLMDRFMAGQGIRPRQWLLGTGLGEAVTRDPAAVVSLNQLNTVYRNIYRLSSYPDIGLRVGRALNLSRWGSLSMALISAGSLREALRTAGRFRLLIHSRFDLPPEQRGDYVVIKILRRDTMSFPVNEIFAHEMLIGTLTSMIGDLLAEPFSFSRIQLHYSAPRYQRSYREHCGCEVEFDCQESGLWIPRQLMTRPLALTNPITEGQVTALCEREFNRLEQLQQGDIAGMVRGLLASAGPPPPGLEQLAEQLAMSPRTLRRRLRDAGTNYRSILKDHQLQVAMQGLARDDAIISTVAEQCGFSDEAGFREAFKRWTRMTPREYRAQFSSKKSEHTKSAAGQGAFISATTGYGSCASSCGRTGA